MEPDELELALGLKFAETLDDLDRLKASVIYIPYKYYFVLNRYHQSPQPGTAVLIDYRAQNKSKYFRKFLDTFSLKESDFASIDKTANECPRPGVIERIFEMLRKKRTRPGD
jgi:hypothetical protein